MGYIGQSIERLHQGSRKRREIGMSYKCECGLELPTQAMLSLHQERYCPNKTEATQATATEKVEVEFAPVMVGRLSVPVPDPFYEVDDEVQEEIDRIVELVKSQPENLDISGPKGSGKTALALQIAAQRGSPVYVANAYTQRSSDEWFGQERVSPETGTYYEQSLFVEAVEQGGVTVVINDLALMQNKAVQNGLNDLLDYRLREAWVEQLAHTLGRPVRVAPGTLFIATRNEGSEYTGNVKLSANILDRFPNRIFMGYPPTHVQVQVLVNKTGVNATDAGRLAYFADSLRQLDEPVEVSMRGLLQAATKLRMGAHIRDAVFFTIISGLPIDLMTKALSSLEAIYTADEKSQVSRREPSWRSWKARHGGA